MKTVILIITVGLIVGCTTVRSPEEAAQTTRIEFDKYANAYVVRGKPLSTLSGPMLDPRTIQLIGMLTNDGGEAFRLEVVTGDSVNRNVYDEASDSTGVALPLEVRDMRATSGIMSQQQRQDCRIPLTRDYLQQRSATGFDIRLAGPRGNLVLKSPPAYIQGFLERFDALKAQSPTEREQFVANQPKAPPAKVKGQ